MKTLSFALAIVSLPFTSLCHLEAREVTLTINTANGQSKGSDEVVVGTNEVAQISTWFPVGQYYYKLEIIKDGLHFDWLPWSTSLLPTYTPPRIAGPATIRLVATGGAANPAQSFCTIQITPETFPPDKTLIIPGDTKGANIILEASTNLIQWTNAPLGLYTNLTGNMFFRIRAERIP